MKTPPRLPHRWLLVPLMLLLFLLVGPQLLRAADPERSELEMIWQRVQDSGSYHFSTDILQKSEPQPTVRNVGREGKETHAHLDGETDLRAESLHLMLWNGGGAVMKPDSAIEVKVEGPTAYARQGDQAWKEINDFTGMFAPGGDFMAYLSASTNVVRHEPETRETPLGTITFTRYTFEIDGPAFAQHMREQSEAQLTAQGQLPPGISLELPEVYSKMTGTGELWVGADGFPIRQLLTLDFPERRDAHKMSAEITVDFSDFNPLPAAYTSASPLASLSRELERVRAALLSGQMASMLSFTSLTLLAAALIVLHRQSKKLYTAVAMAVILSLVSSPLLQIRQMVAFAAKQEARASAQQTQQEQAEAMQERQEQLREPNIDPNTDPRMRADAEGQVRAALAPQATSTISPYVTSSSEYYDDSCGTSPNGHADTDGLTNIEECRLGTLPSYADSDADGVNDNIEVAGFTWNNKQWYTDPTEIDTNMDGINDDIEWETDLNKDGKPDDSDNDGTPDLWERDNDGDGVPDELDLSPYTSTSASVSGNSYGKTFTDASPFNLMLDNLTVGEPTTVEFQIVPTNADHLWYSYSVLDWPEDKQGQIQDGDSKSFYDVDPTLDAAPYDNGDVMLVPMLEIQITGSTDNLPTEAELAEYNISVQQITTNTVGVYVPLSLVTEDDGEKNVAFYGQMLYAPEADWGSTHQYRLIWMVRALNDSCSTYDDEDGLCETYSSLNQTGIIHVYDDSWYLAGMQVDEEHGTDIAVIYEDPTVDSRPRDNEALYELAYGLDSAFLNARDQDNNNQLDITISEIYRRWNYLTNDTVSATDRWNVEDVLTVVKHSYDTSDEGLLDTTVTQTLSILDTEFTSRWSAAAPITPTVMFAQSQSARSLNLDGARSSSTLVSWSGQQLTLNLSSSDPTNPVLVDTTHTLNWTPYVYDAATGDWESTSVDDYWQALGEQLVDDVSESDAELEEAYTFIAQLMYANINAGLASVVKSGDNLIDEVNSAYDSTLADEIGSTFESGMGKILKQFRASFLDADALFFYKSIKTTSPTTWAKQTWLKFASDTKFLVILTLVTLVALAIVLITTYWDQIGWEGVFTTLAVVSFIIAIYDLVKTIVMVTRAVQSFTVTFGSAAVAFTRVMTASAKIIGASKTLAVIGLIIAIGVVVGVFVYMWASGKIEAGTIAFNMALALTLATIIVILVLFIIALVVVGAILVAIFAVIDLILYFALDGWTISGWLAEQLAKYLYSVEVSVDLDSEMGDLGMALVDEEEGYSAGNQVVYSIPMTTTLTHIRPNLYVSGYDQFTQNGIKKNTILYELASQDVDSSGLSATSGQRSSEWQTSKAFTYFGGDYYKARITEEVEATVALSAGINQDAYPLYLNTAYYLYGYDCWTIGIGIYACSSEKFSGNDSEELGESLILDVFPATVDEFMKPTNWANTIIFKDADGDGLLSSAWNGLDPDDSDWDDDNDNLSDAYELELRSLTTDAGGYLVNPAKADTDGDGLDDAEEIRLETNPTNTDTDGDGLTDYYEVKTGWTFTYAVGKTTWIYSDPTNADADADGLDDLAEKNLHTGATSPYNPNVWNSSPLGLYTSLDDDDAVLARGQSFDYTTTAANNLTSDYAARSEVNVTLPSGVSGSPTSALMDLQQGESQSLVSNLTVNSTASSVTTTLASSVEAQFHTPSTWDWDDPLLSTATLAQKVGRAASLSTSTGWDTPFVGATLEQCGLTGSYYNNTTLSGTAVLTRCEGAWLDHEWSGSPGTGVNSDFFSARYTGNFFLEGGSYTFYVRTDDGMRVWIDNTLIIDRWFNQGPTTYSATRTLTTGLHSVKIEYYEYNITATAQFWWDTAVPASFGEDTSNTVVAYKVSADGVYGSGTTLNDTSITTRVHSAPDIACNSSGKCLAVWSYYDPTSGGSGINYALLSSASSSPTLTTRGTLRALSGSERLWRPSVSSDGTNFLVGWREYLASGYTIKTYRVTNAGATTGNLETLYTGTSALEDVDLTWADSRYLAVWSDGSDLWHAFISTTSGFYLPGVMAQRSAGPGPALAQLGELPADLDEYTLEAAGTAPMRVTNTAAATEHKPVVAYDSLGEQALMVYRSTEGSTHTLMARILTGESSTEDVTLTTLSTTDYDADVSYDPQNAGWVVAWTTKATTYYQALAGDGNLRGSLKQIASDDAKPELALACVEPKPMVELNFESSLTDDSGNGRTATCSGAACPATSGSGWDGNGATFDGGDSLGVSFSLPSDNFTTSFWFKTDPTCQNCKLFQRNDLGTYLYLNNGSVCAANTVYNTTGYSNAICSSGENFVDGNWHQVTHVSGSSVNGQHLYVDGVLEASSSSRITCSGALCNASGLTIGSTFVGALDRFLFYNRSLTAREVSDNYTAALGVYSFDTESAGATSFTNSGSNTAFNASCVSGSCPTAGVIAKAYTGLDFDGSNDYLKVAGSSRTVATYAYDFTSSADSVWTNTTRATGTRNGASNNYLGNFTNQEIRLNLTNLPVHDSVEISFDLYVIGGWDGTHTAYGPDYWKWGYDGTQVIWTTFNNQPDAIPQYQFYPSSPWTPSGITLYQHWDSSTRSGYGPSTHFTADDDNFGDNTIGHDTTSAYSMYANTAAILYQHYYYGDNWTLDGGRSYYPTIGTDTASSIRVFAAAQRPKTGANSGDTITANGWSNPVYSMSKTLSSHSADSLSLFFQGWNLETDAEWWGIDNVKVTLKSSSVPLQNRSFTLSAWSKRDTSGTDDFIITQGSSGTNTGLHFGYRSGNTFTCAFYGNDLDTSSAYTDVGGWHHWACTYDASTNTRTLYRDGVQVAQNSAGSDYSGSGALYIGSFWNATNFFDGTLDEVGVWNQALSAEDVYDLYAKIKILDDSLTTCMVPRSTDLATMPFNYLGLRETTTYLGTGSKTTTQQIVLDASAPTASITSIASGKYLNSGSTFAIGGTATDSFGEVASVELRVDGGSWQKATGTEAWGYTLNTASLTEGSHTLQVRATDVAGNVGSASSAITVYVDRAAPTSTSGLASNALLAGRRNERGRWIVPLSGTVSDPNAGSSAGSGVSSLEVLLRGQDEVEGNGWQTATVSGSGWSIEYALPLLNDEDRGDELPTGLYTLYLRATDKAGNTTTEASYTQVPIQLDVSPPVATLTNPISTTTVLTTTTTIAGTVAEPGAATSGISALEVSFTPAEQVSLVGESQLHLPMDDPALSRTFKDVSGQANDAVCNLAVCPQGALEGKVHYAIGLDGSNHFMTAGNVNLANQSFTLSAWVKRASSGTNDMILAQGSGTGSKGLHFGYRNTNLFTCGFWGNDLDTTAAYTDVNEWHQWTCTYDAATNMRSIYRDGTLLRSVAASADYSGTGNIIVGKVPFWSGTHYQGMLDDVMIHTRSLSAHEVGVLYQAGSPTWNAVTLAQSGSGVSSTSWSYTLPSTLDGIYQIDFRATDPLGNRTSRGSDQRGWRGEIDTKAPTVSVTASQANSQTTYTCQATDFNLDEDASCVPLSTTAPIVRLPLNDSGTVTTFADTSGNGYNATCSGNACPTTGQSGQVGNALTFDGTDDIITIPDAAALDLNQLSLSLWIKPTAQKTNWQPLLTKQNSVGGSRNYGLFIIPNSTKVHFNAQLTGCSAWLGGMDSTSSMTLGQWNHVALTYDGSTFRLYLNGVQEATKSSIVSLCQNNEPVKLGAEVSGYVPFAGGMDEVRIYNRALTATEVSGLYQPPTLDLPLNEANAATTFSDNSGRVNDATCSSTGCPTAGGAGQVGTALTFDGSNDYLSTSSSMSTNFAQGDFTIGAWVKTTATGRGIVTKSDGDTSWEQGEKTFYINNVGQPTFVGYGNEYIFSTKAVNDGTWHYVAVVWDYSGSGTSGTRKMYVDGVDVTASNSNYFANNADVAGHLVRIGLPNYGGGEAPGYFSGALDEVHIYNRALSATELAAYYQKTSSIPTFRPTDLSYTTFNSLSAWYSTRFNTLRSYQMNGSRTYTGYHPTAVTLQACDLYGHCSTASSSGSLLREEAEAISDTLNAARTPTLSAALASPTDGTILLSTEPITVSGHASAPRALKELTISLDGTPIHSQSWTEEEAISNTLWSFAWTPPAEGQYGLSLSASDWDGASINSQPITVTVDTQDPAAEISSQRLTSNDVQESTSALLRGSASDTLDVARLDVQVDGGPWQQVPLTDGTWQLPWYSQLPPDGVAYSVSTRVTDGAGRTSTRTSTITVDLVPPTPVTITLSYMTSGGQSKPLAAGQTLRDASSLTMSWPASTDGSGIQSYRAGWTRSATPNAADLTAYTGAGSHSQGAGEAERWYAHLLITDNLGNTQTQTLGPVYVDAPTTPDFVSDLYYQGWSENVCSVLSIDRRLTEMGSQYEALSGAQSFYSSWDSQALRLSWVGANWQRDGDLFIYLDTQTGGATQLYDPYSTPNTEIFMPGHYPDTSPPPPGVTANRTEADGEPDVRQRFLHSTQQLAAATIEADYLVFVEDEQSATLLRWDGTQWLNQQALDATAFRLDTQRSASTTDLLLPFAWLGISDPTTAPLSLLAVATEEEALQLWATAPDRNPISSPRVVDASAAQQGEFSFAMIRPITFANLASGQCPNGKLAGGPGAFADSDLVLSLSATPVGTTYGFMQQDLAWLWALLFGVKGGPVPSGVLGFRDVNHPRVANGQQLTYKLHYVNQGTEAASGVKVAIYGWYSLALPNSLSIRGGEAQYKVLDVGTVPPGGEGTITFTGVVDSALGRQRYDQCVQTAPRPDICVASRNNASVNAYIYDSRDPLIESQPGMPTRPALEWLWGDHGVDTAPPVVALTEPLAVVRPGANLFQGYAYDSSDIPMIALELKSPSGQISRQNCPDTSPNDGRWRCSLNVGSLTDGNTVEVRVQATDKHGNVSPWSLWRTLTVDSTPPTVTGRLDTTSGVVGQGIHTVSGEIIDERDIASVEVCRVGGSCESATVQATSHTTNTMSVYDDVPASPIALNQSNLCFAGTDIVRSFNVTDDFVVGDVDFGFNATHPHRESIQVILQSPNGRSIHLLAGPPDSTNPYRNYDVLLDDSATQPAQSSGGHDDTAAPYFDREVRPMRPLSAFNGQSAKGTWTLRICNGDAEQRSGTYNRSRLYLGPQSTVLYPEGQWSYTIPTTEQPDGVRQELGIYGIDRAGNRTTAPVTITYQLDQVAPVLRVMTSSTQVTPLQQGSTFSGEVSDGSGQAQVTLRLLSPSGVLQHRAADARGSQWSFSLVEREAGIYKVWVEARDAGGNLTTVGPYTVEMVSGPTLYLPLMSTEPPRYSNGSE